MTAPNRGRRVSPTDRTPIVTSEQSAVNLPVLDVMVKGSPISVNAAYGNRRYSTRKRLTKEATTWRDSVIQEIQYALAEQRQHIHQSPIWWRLPLAVTITLYGARGDADNYGKLICDGLKHGLGYDPTSGKLLIDDRHFSPVTLQRAPGKHLTPGCRIEVWQAEAAPAEVEGQGAA